MAVPEDKQIAAFTSYFNDKLSTAKIVNAAGNPVQISNLVTDLGDGVILLQLLEAVAGKKPPKYNKKPRMIIHKLENLEIAINFAKDNGYKTGNICGQDFVDANSKAIIGFFWGMIREYETKHGGDAFRKPFQFVDEYEKKKKEEEERKAMEDDAVRHKEEVERKRREKREKEDQEKKQEEEKLKAEAERHIREEAEKQRQVEERRRTATQEKFLVVCGDADDPIAPAVCAELVKEGGTNVIVCVPNKNTPGADNFRRLGDNVTVVEVSPTDKEGLQRIMGAREVSKVAFVPKAGVGMVDQAKAVGAAAKQAGVKHLVSVGSLGSGKRGNRLQEWYDDAEKAIDMCKVPRTFVRTAPTMSSIAKTAGGDGKITMGAKPVNFIDPEDAGTAIARALTREDTKGKEFNIGGPKPLTAQDIVKEAEEAAAEAMAGEQDADGRPKKRLVKRGRKKKNDSDAMDDDDDAAIGGSASGDKVAQRRKDKIKETEADLLAALHKRQRLGFSSAMSEPEMVEALCAMGMTPEEATIEAQSIIASEELDEASNDFESLTGKKPASLKKFATANQEVFNKPKKVFVVCADDQQGFGQAIAQNLRHNEVPVRCGVSDISSPEAIALRKLGCEVVEVEPTKLASVGKAMDGADKVIMVHDDRPSLPQEAKVIATAAAKLGGVSHLVKISALAADERDTPAKCWHDDAERILEDECDVPHTIVRSAPTMRELTTALSPQLREGEAPQLPTPPTNKVPFVHPSDVADAVSAVAMCPGTQHINETYNLTGPESLTPQEAIDQIVKGTGVKLKPFKSCSVEHVTDLLQEQGIPPETAAGKAKKLAQMGSKASESAPSNDFEKITGKKALQVENFATDNASAYMPAETIAVVNADSLVGTETIRSLCKNPNRPKVRACVRSLESPQAQALASLPHVDVVVATPFKADSLPPAFTGCAKCVVIQEDSPDMAKTAKVIADAAKAAGVQRIIRIGALAPKDAKTTVSEWHAAADKAIEKSGIPHVFVQAAPLMTCAAECARFEEYPFPPDPTLEPSGNPTPRTIKKPARKPLSSAHAVEQERGASKKSANREAEAVASGVTLDEGTMEGDDTMRPAGNPSRRPPRKREPEPQDYIDDMGEGVKKAPNGKVPLHLPIGGKKIAFVHPRDVGQAAAELCTKPNVEGSTFKITGPVALTGVELAKQLSEATGQPVEFTNDAPLRPGRHGPFGEINPENIPAGKVREFCEAEQEAIAALAKYPEEVSNDFESLTGQKPTPFQHFTDDTPIPNLQEPPTIMVTNCDTPLGVDTVRKLAGKSKSPIKACVRNTDTPQAEELRQLENVEVILMDLDDPQHVKTAGKVMKELGVDKVLDLAEDHPNTPARAKALANAAKEAGVKHICKVGVIDSNKQRHPIACWHNEAEKHLKDSGIPTTMVRAAPTFPELINPGIEDLKQPKPILPVLRKEAVAWLAPEDLAEAAASAVTKPNQEGKTFNVTGPEAIKPAQVAKILSEETHKPVEIALVDSFRKKASAMSPIEQQIADAKEKRLKDLPNDASIFPTDDAKKLNSRPPVSMKEHAKAEAEEWTNAKCALVLNADDKNGVGLECVRQLAKKGPVIAGVSSLKSIEADALRKLGPNVQLRVVDSANPEELDAALVDVDKIIDLEESGPGEDDTGRSLGRMAKKHGIKKVVRVGPEVSATTDTASAKRSIQAEKDLKASGVPTSIVRTAPLISQVLADSSIPLQEGKLQLPKCKAFAMADPRDVGEAAARALEQPNTEGKTYHISCGVPMSGEDLASQLMEATGAPIKFEQVPDNVAKKNFSKAGCPDAEAHLKEYKSYGEIAESASPADFEELTGRKPRPPKEFASANPNKADPQHVLVVGGDSPSAIEAVKRMANDGMSVTVACPNPSSPEAEQIKQIPGVKVVPFDPKHITSQVADADHVVMVGAPSPQLPEIAKAVAKATAEKPPKQIVAVGVIGSDKNQAASPISQWHDLAEKALADATKKAGTPHTFLRSAPTMDEAAKVSKTVNRTDENTIGVAGPQKATAWLDPRDMGTAIAAAVGGHIPAKGSGRVFNLTGPKAIQPQDVGSALGMMLEESSPTEDDTARPSGRPGRRFPKNSKPAAGLRESPMPEDPTLKPSGKPTPRPSKAAASLTPEQMADISEPTVLSLTPTPGCNTPTPAEPLKVSFNHPVKIVPGSVVEVFEHPPPTKAGEEPPPAKVVATLPMEQVAKVSGDGCTIEVTPPENVLTPGKTYSTAIPSGSITSMGLVEPPMPPSETLKPSGNPNPKDIKSSSATGVPQHTQDFHGVKPGEWKFTVGPKDESAIPIEPVGGPSRPGKPQPSPMNPKVDDTPKPGQPTIANLTPSPGYSCSDPTKALSITFNHPVNVDTAKGFLTINNGNTEICVPLNDDSVSLSPDKKTLSVDPTKIPELCEGSMEGDDTGRPSGRPSGRPIRKGKDGKPEPVPLQPGGTYSISLSPEGITSASKGVEFPGIAPGQWNFSVQPEQSVPAEGSIPDDEAGGGVKKLGRGGRKPVSGSRLEEPPMDQPPGLKPSGNPSPRPSPTDELAHQPTIKSLSPSPGCMSASAEHPIKINFNHAVRLAPESGAELVLYPEPDETLSPDEPVKKLDPIRVPLTHPNFKVSADGQTVSFTPAEGMLAPGAKYSVSLPPEAIESVSAPIGEKAKAFAGLNRGDFSFFVLPGGEDGPTDSAGGVKKPRKVRVPRPGQSADEALQLEESSPGEDDTARPEGRVARKRPPGKKINERTVEDGPSLNSMSPSPGCTSQSCMEPVVIQFNEPVKKNPLDELTEPSVPGDPTLKPKGNPTPRPSKAHNMIISDGTKTLTVPMNDDRVSISPDGKKLAFNPEPGDLEPGRAYSVALEPESVVRMDRPEKAFGGIDRGEWFFSTAPVSLPQNPLLHEEPVPETPLNVVEPTSDQIKKAHAECPPEVQEAYVKHAKVYAEGVPVSDDFKQLTGQEPNTINDFVESNPEDFLKPSTVAILNADDIAGVQCAKELAKQGVAIRAGVVDANGPLAQELMAIPGCEVVPQEPTKECTKKVIEGCEKVVWLPMDTPDLPKHAQAIAEACEEVGVPHIVKVGVSGSQERNHPIACWHDDAEKKLPADKTTFVRTSVPMNKVAEVAGSLEDTQGSLQLPLGDRKCAFIAPQDIGTAAACAALDETTKGEAYDITGPQGLDGAQLAAILDDSVDKPVFYDDVDDDLAADKVREVGVPESLASAEVKRFTAARDEPPFDLPESSIEGDDTGRPAGNPSKRPIRRPNQAPTKDYKKLVGCEPTSFDTFVCEKPERFTEQQEARVAILDREDEATASKKIAAPKKDIDSIPKDKCTSKKRAFAPQAVMEFSKSLDGNHLDGEWDPWHSGGNHDFSTWRTNPQFKLKVDEPQTIKITLRQKKEPHFHIGWHVVQNTDSNYTVDVSPSHGIVTQTRNKLRKGQSHEKEKEVYADCTLEKPGQTYFLVPSCFYQEKVAPFGIDIVRKGHNYEEDLNDGITIARVKEPRQYAYTLDIRGDWEGPENCPGGRSRAGWRSNPQFRFAIPADTTKRTPAHITVVISRSEQSIEATGGQEDEDTDYAVDMVSDKLAGISMGVNLVKNRSILFPEFVVPNHDLLGACDNSDWSHITASEVAVHATVPVENFGESYFIVPSTGEPNKKMPFICTVHSDTPITVRRVGDDEGEGVCSGGTDKNIPEGFSATHYEGEWNDNNAGGRYMPNKPAAFRTNPQYLLTSDSPTRQPVCVLLTQPSRGKLQPMALHAIRNAAPGLTNGVHPNHRVINSSHATPEAVYGECHEASVEVQVSKDEPIMIVPSCFEPGQKAKFKLTVLSKDKTAKLNTPDPKKDITQKFNGSWKKGSTAGGRPKFGSWMNNPQYVVSGKPGTSVQAVLLQKRPRPASIHIVQNADDVITKPKVMPDYEVLKEPRESGEKEVYFERPELSVGMVLEDSNPVIIVPSTFDPNIENDFELLVISDQPVEVKEGGSKGGDSAPTLQFEGAWTRGSTDGGNYGLGTWRMNPQFKITNSGKTPSSVMLTLQRSGGTCPIGLGVVENHSKYGPFAKECVLPDYTEKAIFSKSQEGKKFKYVKSDNVSLKVDLPAGSTYFAVPSCNKRGELGQFNLTCEPLGDPKAVSMQPTKTKPQTFKNKLPNAVKGEGESVINNPGLVVTCKSKTNICCTFRRAEEPEYAYALALLKNTGDGDRPAKGYKTIGEILDEVDGDETDFISETEGGFSCTCDPGTYFIVPRMMSVDEEEEMAPSEYGEYTITVIPDQMTCDIKPYPALT